MYYISHLQWYWNTKLVYHNLTLCNLTQKYVQFYYWGSSNMCSRPWNVVWFLGWNYKLTNLVMNPCSGDNSIVAISYRDVPSTGLLTECRRLFCNVHDRYNRNKEPDNETKLCASWEFFIKTGSVNISENQSDLDQLFRVNTGFRNWTVYSQITKLIKNLELATPSSTCYIGRVWLLFRCIKNLSVWKILKARPPKRKYVILSLNFLSILISFFEYIQGVLWVVEFI